MSGWRKRQIVEAEEKLDKLPELDFSKEFLFWRAACSKHGDNESLFRKQICKLIKELEEQLKKE